MQPPVHSGTVMPMAPLPHDLSYGVAAVGVGCRFGGPWLREGCVVAAAQLGQRVLAGRSWFEGDNDANCVTMKHTLPQRNLCMVATKTATLNLRIDPDIKEALRVAALREHRSVANMVELLIRQHCEQAGIAIPQQQALFEDADDGR